MLIRVNVGVPSGAFLSLAGILLFLFVLLVLSMSVLNEIINKINNYKHARHGDKPPPWDSLVLNQ